MNDSFGKEVFQRGDVAAAFTLLSRLPLPVDHAQAGDRAAASVWAWPLVGACLGAVAAILADIALFFGAPAGIAAALALAVLCVATGAMHEDGLADCADGLGGGRDRESRLAIMKDSRIGVYGAVALALAVLARWSGIAGLIDAGHLFWPMVAVGAASRLPMMLAMFVMRPAREDGLSAGVGLPPPPAIAAAGAFVLTIGLVALGFGVVPLLFWTLLAPLPLWFLANRLIGGQTGDVLGGSQQLAEIAALSVAVAILT